MEIDLARIAIERYRKFAACFIAGAGVMRLLGLFFLLYFEIPHGGSTALVPTILLLLLGIGVYKDIRGTWTASFLLCTLLAYFLLSSLIGLPWRSALINPMFFWSMIFTTADLTLYVGSIAFLFLTQYKKNRLIGSPELKHTEV